MKMLGICGSLRQASYNRLLLNTVKNILNNKIRYEIHSIDTIPLYNADLDNDQKPIGVQSFIDAIKSADILLFATPEYNSSIPGVLKNAIDWASRPAFQSALLLKTCGIISAARSPVGGARAQADLRNILSSTVSAVFPSVEYLLPMAHNMFNEEGVLIDTQATQRLERYITELINWAKKQSKT